MSGNSMHENRETWETPEASLRDRPAGEGASRTARGHVLEESDSGTVPMNHSNKSGRPPAESEEGRPLIKENTHQLSTHSTHGRKTHVLTCWWRRRRPAPHDNRVFATLGSYEWCGCAWI